MKTERIEVKSFHPGMMLDKKASRLSQEFGLFFSGENEQGRTGTVWVARSLRRARRLQSFSSHCLMQSGGGAT